MGDGDEDLAGHRFDLSLLLALMRFLPWGGRGRKGPLRVGAWGRLQASAERVAAEGKGEERTEPTKRQRRSPQSPGLFSWQTTRTLERQVPGAAAPHPHWPARGCCYADEPMAGEGCRAPPLWAGARARDAAGAAPVRGSAPRAGRAGAGLWAAHLSDSFLLSPLPAPCWLCTACRDRPGRAGCSILFIFPSWCMCVFYILITLSTR